MPVTARGELHVGWVLGGRAVQDVWIVPGRGAPGAEPSPLAFHGSAIRFYDPRDRRLALHVDRSAMGRVRRFIGRELDGDIVMLCSEDEPQLRWRFTDITQGRVHVARRDLPRRRGHVPSRRGDADHPAVGAE